MASFNPLDNLRLIAQACGFHISTGEMLLRRAWIQTRNRLIIAGSISPIPPPFPQEPCSSLSLTRTPIMEWNTPLEDLPNECWPETEQLAWTHNPARVPSGYSRFIDRSSKGCFQIM